MVLIYLYLETTYKNDFVKKDNPICPAKVYLETKAQGLYSGTKSKFNENADFKAMSPNFQAISISKHSYVWVLDWFYSSLH